MLPLVRKSMKPLFLVLLGALSVCAQPFSPFSFGVKGGVPFSDALNVIRNPENYEATTNRYIIGPTVELHLPFGLGVEVDALYRHLSYTTSDLPFLSRTSSGDWEFPLLAKYRFPSKLVKPYVDAGIAFDTLTGLSQTVTETIFGATSTFTTSHPPELNKSTTEGFVMGAGIDVHLLVLHILPEVRYTRWGAQHFLSPNGGLSSSQNQAELLVGITF